jgi:hypothetical protein
MRKEEDEQTDSEHAEHEAAGKRRVTAPRSGR